MASKKNKNRTVAELLRSVSGDGFGSSFTFVYRTQQNSLHATATLDKDYTDQELYQIALALEEGIVKAIVTINNEREKRK
jgi:hypothetical protein